MKNKIVLYCRKELFKVRLEKLFEISYYGSGLILMMLGVVGSV